MLVTGLVAAQVLALSGCSERVPIAAQVPAGATVLAFGDSLTFGTGAPVGSGYPEQLAQLTAWRVVNAGVPGATAVDSAPRLTAALERHRPALVIIGLGGNDLLRGIDEARIRTALQNMIELLDQARIPVVLVSVPRPSALAAVAGALSDHPLYEDLAASAGVPLFADAWSEILSTRALRSDRIHANAEGYRRFAQRLAEFARRAGILIDS
ncbi:MAG: arylesterase [Burkholderiales bacterium]|nr:MAG: arylesterase [Burkholderiales bacterium]